MTAAFAVPESSLQLPLVVLASAAAGVVNSIAGGGTLLTFPALIGLGIPPVVANATSTVALWPAALGSMWGYRRELGGARLWAARFAIPSLAGGLVGALLLLLTPASAFSALAPWLVLGATVLFTVQGAVMRHLRPGPATGGGPAGGPAAGSHPTHDDDASLAPPTRSVLLYQFAVAVYGGYFGAGVGILMLAALGFMGLRNIHRMNGLKNWGGLCINAVALVTFAIGGLVNWPVAASMAVGATAGGYLGAGLAQRVPQRTIRRAVVAVGLVSAAWLLVRGL